MRNHDADRSKEPHPLHVAGETNHNVHENSKPPVEHERDHNANHHSGQVTHEHHPDGHDHQNPHPQVETH